MNRCARRISPEVDEMDGGSVRASAAWTVASHASGAGFVYRPQCFPVQGSTGPEQPNPSQYPIGAQHSWQATNGTLEADTLPENRQAA